MLGGRTRAFYAHAPKGPQERNLVGPGHPKPNDAQRKAIARMIEDVRIPNVSRRGAMADDKSGAMDV